MTVSARTTTVRFEQAVYGSFAFRDDGYALLARSPGCRPEWLATFRAACQRVGERPAGAVDAPGLFALSLDDWRGPFLVVGMSPQGRDDRGRPGALAFHALFVSPREFRKVGFNPFRLAGSLRSDWSSDVVSLPAGSAAVAATDTGHGPGDFPPDPQVAAVAAALGAGRRVIVESPGPIDDLARSVWRVLSPRVRRRARVATWTFANGLRFDLLGVPRLAGVTVDASYVVPAALPPADTTGRAAPGDRVRSLVRRRRPVLAVGGVAALALAGVAVAVAVAVAVRGAASPGQATTPDELPARGRPVAATGPVPADLDAPPDRAAVPAELGDDDPAVRRRVAEVLADLADRCGVVVRPGGASDPGVVMQTLARDLRYRGPWLSDSERSELAAVGSPEADLALAWHARVRRFADDRPLPAPAGFRDAPVRWQLAVLTWSFHADDRPSAGDRGPRRTPTELAQRLAGALAVDVPVRGSRLAGRFPVLSAYAEFLRRLPPR